MAKQDDGGRLPGGMGGLVTYYDEYEEPLQIDPKVITAFILLFIGAEIMLHWQAGF